MSTQTSRVAKYTTIEALEAKNTGPVYVLNATSGELKGNLLITIQKLTGNGSDLVRVPQTFVPIDLAMQVSKRQLLASSEFRQTINKGMLKLPSPEYAKMLLESETGKEEWRRIQNEMNAAKQLVENAVVQEPSDDDYIDIPKEEVRKPSKAKAAVAKASSKEADMKVKALAGNAKNDGWTQIRIVGALQSYGDLSRADVSYLAKQFKDSAKVIRFLKTYAKENGYLDKK
jgi:hypothetical protein